MLRTVLVFLPLLAACKDVEQAPADLDDLLHALWQGYPHASDEQLAATVVDLHEQLGADSLDETIDGAISSLSDDEASLVRAGQDAGAAQGLYLARPFSCTLETLEPILYDLRQDDLYPGNYDSYARAYSSDLQAYQDREIPFLTWQVSYTATILGDSYRSHLQGGLRYLPASDEQRTPFGAMLFSRVWIDQPAEFEEGVGKSMDQDYQVEAFYERSPGEILHVYALWREADFGAWGTTADEGIQRSLLNALSDWDDQTEENCAADLP